MSLNVTHYARARTLDEAVELLRTFGSRARILAGGTDLMGTIKDRIHGDADTVLIDVKSVDELAGIHARGTEWTIGALTRLTDIERDPDVASRFRALAQAAGEVASPQLRNMGTVGGNICQEPRCWYYRNYDDVFHCIRKGGPVCNAQTGENRYHSLFGAARIGSPPCTSECPTNNDSPEYFARVREGDLAGAARILLRTNPLPAVTGRVCPQYCEQSCNRGEFDEAVSIRALERHVGDYILESQADLIETPADSTGKSVAIVGAGPAGLTAAYYLRRRGHRVRVLDRMEQAGGMLRYSIPAFRLPRDVVEGEAGMLSSLGVEFQMGTEVGKDLSLGDLRRGHDAVLVATGTWKSRILGLEGEEHLLSGLEFLADVAKDKVAASGPRVLVIGGGDVAVDVAVTARRLGAAPVHMVCLERRAEMPAIDADVQEALEEGIELTTSYGPSRVVMEDGKVTGMDFVRCTSVFDPAGRFAPEFDRAEVITIEADQIILAIGQAPDLAFLADTPELVGDRGTVATRDDLGSTALEGVFAAGDAVGGAGTVVKAIAAARRAADAIDVYLGGVGSLSVAPPEVGRTSGVEDLAACGEACRTMSERISRPAVPAPERKLQLEDVGPVSLDDAAKEAHRCMSCGCVAVSPSDIAPALIVLDATVRTSKREIPVELFFDARLARSTVLDADEIVREIAIPASSEARCSSFIKFRIRQSIDFPVLCAAVSYRLENGLVRDARVSLGAAAPIPLRLRAVERALEGKPLGAETAEAASRAVAEGTSLLARNRYKLSIAKALVRRAILDAA